MRHYQQDPPRRKDLIFLSHSRRDKGSKKEILSIKTKNKPKLLEDSWYQRTSKPLGVLLRVPGREKLYKHKGTHAEPGTMRRVSLHENHNCLFALLVLKIYMFHPAGDVSIKSIIVTVPLGPILVFLISSAGRLLCCWGHGNFTRQGWCL